MLFIDKFVPAQVYWDPFFFNANSLRKHKARQPWQSYEKNSLPLLLGTISLTRFFFSPRSALGIFLRIKEKSAKMKELLEIKMIKTKISKNCYKIKPTKCLKKYNKAREAGKSKAKRTVLVDQFRKINTYLIRLPGNPGHCGSVGWCVILYAKRSQV